MVIDLRVVHGFEWHDGWIASLLEAHQGWFACVAISIDWNTRSRRFLLVPVREDAADKTLELFKRHGLSEPFSSHWCALFESVTAFTAKIDPVEKREISINQLMIPGPASQSFLIRLPTIDVLL